MALIGRPYIKEIKASTIKAVTKKMATFKGKRSLQASEFKKVCQASPEIKYNPELSRVASNIEKSMKGSGPRDISTKTWRSKQFIEAYGKALKKVGKENVNIKTTKFGRKTIIENPKSGFQKYVVEEQIKKNAPTGPSKEELARQAKIAKARQEYYQYGRQKEIYGDKDVLAVARSEDNKKPAEQVNVSSPKKATNNVVPFARGTSLPKNKGIDTGTGMVGTFSQTDDSQKDTSTNKVANINKYKNKEKSKKDDNETQDPDHFGKDIDVVDEAA